MNITTREVLLADPFVVLLGLAGMMSMVSRFSTAPPADRFFASWAAFGLLSNLIQIYPQYRYVTTITPALAYLGVRFVDRLLAGRRVGSGLPLSFDSSQALVLTLVLSFVAYQIAQVSLGIYRQPNRSYWRLVEWVSENVPNETRILVAPYIGISLPNRSYDFYRMIHRYDGLQRPLDQVLAEHDISSIIADDQWHKYQNADMKAFLAKRCTVKARVASFRIFTCDVTPDVLPGIPGATTVPTP